MPVLSNITIISGGQTGADRAALDFAIANGLAHGGWCPRQRRAEDGVIPAHYLLHETPSGHYSQRTQRNVRGSDATVVFSIKPRLSGGTRLTFELAKKQNKPVLLLGRDKIDVESAAERLRKFIEQQHIRVVNIAGPRASQEPEIAAFVIAVLTSALGDHGMQAERQQSPPG